MNTKTLTTEQQEEVAKLLKAFDVVTPAHEEMAIRLVIQKSNEAQKSVDFVERKMKCANGHSRKHLFQIQMDDDGKPARNDRGHIHAMATCEVCDGDFYAYLRLTSND